MILVAGPASTYLAEKIAEIARLKLIKLEHKLFPDGESYIRFPESVKGRDLVVIQGTHPPQDKHLVQAYFIAENAVDLGANSVSLIAPYLAYARQDKRFFEGEVISIKSVLRMLKSAGYEKIYTVNVHSPWISGTSPIPLINIHAEKVVGSYLKRLNIQNPIVVSVGKKGEEMASAVAGELGTEYIVAKSSRDKVTGQVVVEIDRIRGLRDVIVVDDIISTGGTMVEVIKALKRMGAEKVYVACVHALMVGGASEKIMEVGAEEIIASDTIPNEYSKYSVAGILAEEILRGK
ncbi:MAG: ribose-phosphate diphosphokinase [Aigarchaeota archaeon]|nr:ribose-phosphate diphosphokinase [Aigarchaeota archaeon]MDW8021032.1 ribose-phosphate diphosphokinase [Nitrososphaerota archaeon]